MTFTVALWFALVTLVGGVLFAAVGDMMGWDVLGRGLVVAASVLAVAVLLPRIVPPAPAAGHDDDLDVDVDDAAEGDGGGRSNRVGIDRPQP